jgi:hypothetical protein|uniref:Uncharacterized protein n=1 Tax=Myoviridae sp. ctqfO1 TaxID=2827710 RepID=A0A8S5T3H9_9CAUD|nr:MAG TPA: hypothetical protein [Myoviridae sp. ctqfO1]
MAILAVKKDRLEELTKFGFVSENNFFVYKGNNSKFEYTVRVPCFCEPVISISEFDTEDIEDSTVIYVPDVVMDLIEAGMVERNG